MPAATKLVSTVDLPVIDLRPFLERADSPEAKAECLKLADAIKTYSAFAIRDPRVSEQENSDFLDLIEDYFNQPTEVKMKDVKPELSYQVGATPSHTELPRCGRDDDCLEMVEKMAPEDRPLDFNETDPKWRYFWRMGDTPKETKFAQLNADPVIPEAFPDWSNQMNHWGDRMLNAVNVTATMLAIGLGLPADTFTNLAHGGPHLLAPTATDLSLYGKTDTVIAGFHSDLNFLTIHGKSRYPGLHIWTREGQKLLVKIPNGCLLVQAAKQIEFLTGGAIVAGFHEVCVVDSTLTAIERQKALGRPTWRISSTLFYHLASDNILEPLDAFKTEENVKKYPRQYVGEQVQRELGFLELDKN
ncbi:hypothetical protein BC833DRAFT_624675 [Globomyces pollinis-pini]|nr:hypothetical protein BC833DRAFT_624675 [Globomyces pollinis-pini]